MMKYIIALCVLMICITVEAVVGIVYNSSDTKQYEPTSIQILHTMEEVLIKLETLCTTLDDMDAKAGNARGLVEDTIQLIRDEVNGYNEAFGEEIQE